MDTGSQVCALAWSSAEDALVSAHGYSLNQILIWRLPELARDGVLAGHGKRVLYLVWFGVLERTFHAIDATFAGSVARQPRRRHGRGRRVAPVLGLLRAAEERARGTLGVRRDSITYAT